MKWEVLHIAQDTEIKNSCLLAKQGHLKLEDLLKRKEKQKLNKLILHIKKEITHGL